METRVFAPAKINLCLHVTGQRADGYHLLQSLVVFADIGDWVTLRPSDAPRLSVTGPRAAGVPVSGDNLCLRAAAALGRAYEISLDKHLPAAAGIGGGSADAAAVLRGARGLGADLDGVDPLTLGADVPVCLEGRAAIMSGIGEGVTPMSLPAFSAVLVNPGVDVPTPQVFRALREKTNPPMDDLPDSRTPAAVLDWLRRQRNDLERPAIASAPVIAEALDALSGAQLARMSGSGATCLGLYPDAATAQDTANRIAAARPDWWVVATRLG